MQLRQLRPSPSLVVASLSLAVATGGTSYAAMMVGSPEIRDGSVRSVDVADDSVRSKDVHDGSIQWKDFRPGARPMESRWALVDAQRRDRGPVRRLQRHRRLPGPRPLRWRPQPGQRQRVHQRRRGPLRQRRHRHRRAAEHRRPEQRHDHQRPRRRNRTPTPSSPARSPPAMCQPGHHQLRASGHGQHQPPGREPAAEQRLLPPTTPTASGSTSSSPEPHAPSARPADRDGTAPPGAQWGREPHRRPGGRRPEPGLAGIALLPGAGVAVGSGCTAVCTTRPVDPCPPSASPACSR